MLVAVFTAIKIFSWVSTMYEGEIVFNAPLVYLLGFIFLMVFGGMTGVALATVGLDPHWHDTYFVVAHFHFIMAGPVLLAFLAALHFWFPKMFGKRYSERLSLMGAVTTFFGFFATFTPQFLLGNMGMPRRYYAYPPQFQWLHVASTMGASVLAAGLLLTLGTLLHALIWGERALQSVGLTRLRVDHGHAALRAQLRRHPTHQSRPVRGARIRGRACRLRLGRRFNSRVRSGSATRPRSAYGSSSARR